MTADLLIPVAQYIRMSTEHQQYSLDNQQAAIQAYADAHGFCVAKTYTDGSRSGVVLRRRKGLSQLLQDAVRGGLGFKAVLVYDVTRWGRFQDADESAHYEFLCKSGGIPIHYCAETFINDGTPANMLMKALKRTMAGEYSRELGVKVLAGLKRLALLGFKQGGSAGYGLRRMLVSASGEVKQQLAPGERKSIATDRVILVPGPTDELDRIRDIYRLFNEEKRTVYSIARELNRRGIKYVGDSKWDYAAVHHILSHPKYTGCNLFGRTSQKLGTPPVSVSEAEWVRTPNAFIPIVDDGAFQKAQQRLRNRTVTKSNEAILAELQALLAKQQRLSLQLIKDSSETPSPSTYRHRFGSLRRAYALIGYGHPQDFGPIDLRRRTQAIREDLMNKIHAMFPTETSIVRRSGRWRSQLKVNGNFTVSVNVARAILTKTRGLIWRIDPVLDETRYPTLLALLNCENSDVTELYLFPRMDRHRRFHIVADNEWFKGGIRLKQVSEFRGALENTPGSTK